MDPGKARGQCDQCGTALVQRKDDMAEVIAERLQVYHTATQPLIRHYQEQGSYIEVDGDRPINEVFDTIIGIAKSRAN